MRRNVLRSLQLVSIVIGTLLSGACKGEEQQTVRSDTESSPKRLNPNWRGDFGLPPWLRT